MDEPGLADRPLHVGVVAVNIRKRDGQGRVCLEVIRALVGRGHKVTAYSSTISEELLGLSSVRWVRIKQRPGPALVFYPLFVAEATAAVNRRRHDVVFLMGSCALPRDPVAYYAAFTEAGWRAAGGGSGSGRFYKRLYSRLALTVERRVAKRVAWLLAITKKVAQEMRPMIAPGTRETIVPGGVDLEEFPPVTEGQRALARRQLGIPADRFAIALVGEFATGRKGLEELATAVAMGHHPNEVIYLHGHGPPQKAAKLMHDLNLAGRIEVIDPAIPVPVVMAASDLLAIPSLYEPFSLVALEAAASASPIVISERAGAATYLDGAALLVDPGEPKSIRKSIDRIQQELGLRRELGKAARRVAEGMTWERVALLAVDSIEELAAGGTG